MCIRDRDIKEQQEELKARKRLLQKTYQQEAKRRKAEEQNRLLNLIQSQTTGQLELMTHFMEELEVTESKDVYERLLCLLYTSCEMEEIDGRPCRVFVLGTNHDGQFVREQYYAVSDNLVYVYDVIDDCWLIPDRN